MERLVKKTKRPSLVFKLRQGLHSNNSKKKNTTRMGLRKRLKKINASVET
jgi:hypothetical protein